MIDLYEPDEIDRGRGQTNAITALAIAAPIGLVLIVLLCLLVWWVWPV